MAQKKNKKNVYLDYAAATPVLDEVLRAMQPYWSEMFANSSSLHNEGEQSHAAIEEVRLKLKKILHAGKGDEIIFTSSATESNNLAIQGVMRADWVKEKMAQAGLKKPHLIMSAIDHDAALQVALAEKRTSNYEVDLVGVDEWGRVKLDELKKLIRPKQTVLVSIIHGHYQFGTIQDLKAISEICHQGGALLHTDAAQSFGHVKIDVQALGIDLLTASAAKIYGPKGAAFLYKSARVGKLEPLFYGGGQEEGQRSGTLATPLIVGLGVAAEVAARDRESENKRLAELRDYAIKRILTEIPHSHLNGLPVGDKNRLPHNINISFAGAEGESLLLGLDEEGIAVSTGSACSSKSLRPDHSLLALGLGPAEAHGSLRMTLGRSTSKEDLDYLIGKLKVVVSRLRTLSPLGK